jgi:hypothetical protein
MDVRVQWRTEFMNDLLEGGAGSCKRTTICISGVDGDRTRGGGNGCESDYAQVAVSVSLGQTIRQF